MLRVALVYLYFRTRAATEILFASLGVATLAGGLHARGIEAKVFDCTFDQFEPFHQALLAYQPDIVGIYCMITLSRNTFRVAKMVRADLPGSKLFERVSGLDMDRDWDKENEVTFVYNSEFDETWLRGRIAETMRAFSEKN